MKYAQVYKILFFIWFIAVLFLTAFPNSALKLQGGLEFDSRGYWQHALAYGMGMFLAYFSKIFSEKWKSAEVVICWGILLEIIQRWLPYRSFNLFDILANLSGIMLVYLALVIYSSQKVQSKSKI